jgi:NTP pyrophosphatase (non-canonical NTP hydrolase)
MRKNMNLNLTDFLEPSIDEAIFGDIIEERQRQLDKWGVQTHNMMEWMTILAEEFGEACRAANECYFRDHPLEELRKELIETMAVALAIVEGIDEYESRDDE